MRAQVLFYLAVLAAAVAALRLLTILRLPNRQPWMNSKDPAFQGDGWRWTLSLLLPNLPLPVRFSRQDGRTVMGTVARIMRADHGTEPPFTLDMLPLTVDQRLTCWSEWDLAQREQARLGRPLERWETINREEQP